MGNKFLLTYKKAIGYEGIVAQIINTYKWFVSEDDLKQFVLKIKR
jgi:hypothetical protein